MMRNPTTIKWKRTCACTTLSISSEVHLIVFIRLQAMAHPRCVGWGEIGLDYHYDNSPRDIQQRAFIRQLRQAIKLAKPLTIHTREADEDTLRILKEEVPKDHRVSHSILRVHLSTKPPLICFIIVDTRSLFYRHA